MKTEEYKDIKFYRGENAIDNFELLDKFKSFSDYIWLHLNSFSSGYIIIEIEKNELLKRVDYLDIMNYASNLCKQNSKYKNVPNIKIIWTTISKVIKTEKIGQVIISGKKNFIKL